MEKKYDYALVSGGFDPVHVGHLRMFQDAERLANKVITFSDENVKYFNILNININVSFLKPSNFIKLYLYKKLI